METKQFKSESKRLLDLMINSIYTHREIFLRELISNASDAIDKLYYQSLTNDISGLNRDDFSIKIEADKNSRILKITDNGCGMNAEELENNLGTIAKSGSLSFKKENKANDDIDIIGQFGVGFYSAFMVSKCVTVISKPYGGEKAYKWHSEGVEGYTIEECDYDIHGTTVILEIKDNTDDDNYDEFLEQYRIESLVKKYSDYIRYPIKMNMERSKLKEDSNSENPQYETYFEETTLNSMVPLWKRNKNELKEEDYNEFYKEKFFDYKAPVRVIHSSTEGAATYNALMFIPSKAPYNYYTKEYKKGLQLYASGVLIMDKCEDLLPDHFSFVKGLVDSQDLSLNISRELLQHDKQLKIIASRLEKKIKSELKSMLLNEREKYEEFFKNFGLQIKYGLYSSFGVQNEQLKDLIMFYSSTENKLVTLEEYRGRMTEEQKYIYYACGENVEKIDKLPQTEAVKEKGYEILYLTEDVDEFALQILREFDGKEFRSVSSGDLGLETEDEKKESEKAVEEHKEMLDFMIDCLDGKVKAVRPSQRLKTHPVCLSSEGAISIEMEKVMGSSQMNDKVKAEKVLEINASHEIFTALADIYNSDKDKFKAYTKLLYTQALLIEGLPIEDPVDFTNEICKIMSEK